MDSFKRATLPEGGYMRDWYERPSRVMRTEIKRQARQRLKADLRAESTDPSLHPSEIGCADPWCLDCNPYPEPWVPDCDCGSFICPVCSPELATKD